MQLLMPKTTCLHSEVPFFLLRAVTSSGRAFTSTLARLFCAVPACPMCDVTYPVRDVTCLMRDVTGV
eukprot:3681770-Rhodomonas_salina.2